MTRPVISVYIAGASGYLGSQFENYLYRKNHKIFNNRIDVTDFHVLKSAFSQLKPDVVINFSGAKASPNIDWCEDHKEETVAINVIGATNVMLAALQAGSYPIQISSGCIYSGLAKKEFTEEDEPNFYGSFYSRMRIVLQQALAELPVLYARIRMPLSSNPHPRNFLNKITSYKRVISVPNSVTLVEDLWPALEHLMTMRPTGILNLTNEGYCTHEEILNAYKKYVDPNHTYEPISLDQLEGPGGITKAKRSNCVLSMEKAKGLGINMPPLTQDRLGEIMKKYSTQRTIRKLARR